MQRISKHLAHKYSTCENYIILGEINRTIIGTFTLIQTRNASSKQPSTISGTISKNKNFNFTTPLPGPTNNYLNFSNTTSTTHKGPSCSPRNTFHCSTSIKINAKPSSTIDSNFYWIYPILNQFKLHFNINLTIVPVEWLTEAEMPFPETFYITTTINKKTSAAMSWMDSVSVAYQPKMKMMSPS
jgi:hypothetical protein